MKTFGLTGGIACGKSTVAKLLSSFPNIVSFDCDQIAKEILAREEHQHSIASILGRGVMGPFGLDRGAIAKIIFSDEEKKRQIESLIHPLVWEELQRRISAVPENSIVIAESAIFFEAGWQDKFDGMIVAACPPTEQIRRLRVDRNMSFAQISDRINAQMPLAEKVKRADFIIYSDCSREELAERVHSLYLKLQKS
jgi:dephospho-CoA kinase